MSRTSELAIETALPGSWERMRGDLMALEETAFPIGLREEEGYIREILGLARSVFVLARAAERVVGDAFGGPIEDPAFAEIPGVGSVPHFGEDKVCYIESLVVHPEFQRRGIGKKLLEAFFADAIEKKYKFVAGHALEGGSHHLFVRAGASILGANPNWYGTGKTSYCFLLPLLQG